MSINQNKARQTLKVAGCADKPMVKGLSLSDLQHESGFIINYFSQYEKYAKPLVQTARVSYDVCKCFKTRLYLTQSEIGLS